MDSKSKHKKSNAHLRTWLNIRHLLTNKEKQDVLPDSKSYIMSIIEGFDVDTLYQFAINNAKEKELSQMYEIIKQAKIQNTKQKPKKTKSEQIMPKYISSKQMFGRIKKLDTKQQEPINKKQYAMFKSMPNELIGYISGFLKRADVETFKNTCYNISIVCLQEMTKQTVGICHMNGDTDLDENGNITSYNYCRYNKNQTFQSLFDGYSKNYGIPTQYQLLMIQQKSNPYTLRRGWIFGEQGPKIQIVSNEMIKYSSLYEVDYLKKYFMLFDQRKVVLLNASGLMPVYQDNIVYAKSNYKIIKINYFNIMNQTCELLFYMIANKYLSINQLIKHIGETKLKMDNNNVYQQLLMHIKSIKSDSNPFSCLHPLRCLHDPTLNVFGHFRLFECDKSSLIKDAPSFMIIQLNVDKINFNVTYMGDLKLLKNDLKNYSNIRQQALKHCNIEQFCLNPISYTVQSEHLMKTHKKIKQDIAHSLGELIACSDINIRQNSTEIKGRVMIKNISFGLIPPFTATMDRLYLFGCIYLITLRIPMNKPRPFKKKQPLKIAVRYYKRFAIKDLIQYLYELIAKDPLHKDKYDTILDFATISGSFENMKNTDYNSIIIYDNNECYGWNDIYIVDKPGNHLIHLVMQLN